jgi:hypothetical protein
VYHIFADLTNRHDLPQQASALLRSEWQRLFRRPQQEPERQHYDALAFGYAALSVIGIGGSLVWFAWYLAPATFIAYSNEIALLGAGVRAMNFLAQLDSAVALLLQSLGFLLLGWSIARTYRAKARQKRQQSALNPES